MGQDVLSESAGAWYRSEEDDEDEKNGFICKECIGDDEQQYGAGDMLTEKKLNTLLKHGDLSCDKFGKKMVPIPQE